MEYKWKSARCVIKEIIAHIRKTRIDCDWNVSYSTCLSFSQECQNSIERSIVLPSKELWERVLKIEIGTEYKMMKTETLAATHLAVFVRADIAHGVVHIHSARIATGLGNILGNKVISHLVC